MTCQTPDVLLNQIDKNLRSASDVKQTAECSQEIKDMLSEGDYTGLVADLNKASDRISDGSQEFDEEDFQGSLVYPDEEFSEWYKEKHTLPPLSFGLLIPPERWKVMSRKLNLYPRHEGQSLDSIFFEDSEIGLQMTGITFHLDRDARSDVEFEVLQKDIELYSAIQSEAQRITPRKLTQPVSAQLIFEHMLLSDLCAWRTDPDHDAETLTGYLHDRLNYYIQQVPTWLKLPPEFVSQTKTAYSAILRETFRRIPDAVNAAYTLDATIGTQLTTPVLFSLGSTEEDMARMHLLSPLLGLKNFQTYLEQGDITPSQIIDRLHKKGHMRFKEATILYN
jgi:hypothetical protein